MQPVPLLRVRALGPLLHHLARLDDPEATRLGRTLGSDGDEDALVPLSLAGELWAKAARLTGRTDLGLHIGGQTRLAEASDLGRVMASAATLGEGLEAGVRGAARFNSGQRIWRVDRDDETAIRWRYAPSVQHGRREANEYVLMLVVGFVRSAAGARWRPLDIDCEGDPPLHAATLEALARRRVRWEQSSMALVLPRALLSLPLPAHPGASQAATISLPDLDFARSVRQTVGSLLRLGVPVLPAAAHAAGTSVRSFQRRLESAGIRFGQLVQESRYEAARRMLRESERTILEISAELGYSDSANFTRAFRRWAGVPPQEYRRLAAAEDGPGPIRCPAGPPAPPGAGASRPRATASAGRS